MSTNSRHPFTLYVLVALLIFLSFGAFFGAYHLLTDPSGISIGFPAEMRAKLPLPNFTLPGLFLLFVYGIGSLVVVYALVKRVRFAWWAALALGTVLVGWVIGEFIMFQLIAGIMVFTALLGILIIIFTIVPPTKRYYSLH